MAHDDQTTKPISAEVTQKHRHGILAIERAKLALLVAEYDLMRRSMRRKSIFDKIEDLLFDW